MTRTARRLSVICVGIAAVGFGTTLPVVLDTRSECERARQWVKSHRLPGTLADLTALPEPYQRAAFAALPPAAKSEVFRERIRSWAAGRTLSSPQREALDAVLSFATPANYAGRGQARRDLLERLDNAFSPADTAEAFTSLGSAAGSYGTWAGASLQLQRQLRAILVAKADPCDCSVGSAFACDGCDPLFDVFATHCKPFGWSNCAVTQGGCGFLWMYPCDGRCCYMQCTRPWKSCLD